MMKTKDSKSVSTAISPGGEGRPELGNKITYYSQAEFQETEQEARHILVRMNARTYECMYSPGPCIHESVSYEFSSLTLYPLWDCHRNNVAI